MATTPNNGNWTNGVYTPKAKPKVVPIVGSSDSWIGSGPTTPVVPPVPPVQTPGSADSILGGESEYERLQREAYANSQGPIDEEAIKRQAIEERQKQIDATNAVYADIMQQAKVGGQGRLGTNTAMQARGGLLGSDFGAAQTNTVEAANNEIYKSVDLEKNVAIQNILSDARKQSTQDIADKRAAKEAGYTTYVNYLAGEPERKATKSKNAAITLLRKGLTTKDITDEALKAAGINRNDLENAYYDVKTQEETAQAEAETTAKTTSLAQEKAQLDIDKMKYDAAHPKANTEIVLGNGGHNILVNSDTGEIIKDYGVKDGPKDPFAVASGSSIYDPKTGTWITPTGGTGVGTKPSGSIVSGKIGGKPVKIDSVASAPLQNAMANMPGAIIGSTYRTYDEQKKLYDAYVAGTGGRAAAPGTSRHETGMAVDLYGGTGPNGKLLPPTPEMVATMAANGWIQGGANGPIADDLGHFEYMGTGTSSRNIEDVTLPDKATEFTKKSYGFASRMAEAKKNIDNFDIKMEQSGNWSEYFTPRGELVANLFKSSDRQMFEQAQRDFVNAILRQESGAAISDGEFKNAIKQYFPVAGDTNETIAQKRKNRETATLSMMTSAGVTDTGEAIKDIYLRTRENPEGDVNSNSGTPPPTIGGEALVGGKDSTSVGGKTVNLPN